MFLGEDDRGDGPSARLRNPGTHCCGGPNVGPHSSAPVSGVSMKAFFTAIAANLVTIAICVVGMFILLIGIVTAAAGDKPVSVRPGSVLVMDLGQTLVDQPSQSEHRSVLDDALLAGGRNTVPLRGAILALKAAADDEHISSVLIHGNINPSGYGSGYAALRELRAAIAAFRASK